MADETKSTSSSKSSAKSDDEAVSRQAHFSTYKPDPDVPDDVNPPPGPSVVQELGKPSEGDVTPTVS